MGAMALPRLGGTIMVALRWPVRTQPGPVLGTNGVATWGPPLRNGQNEQTLTLSTGTLCQWRSSVNDKRKISAAWAIG
jgi:hypothetical protein